MEKQIYAALEIADSEIRLIVGEFFNTRFNILKVERVACSTYGQNGLNKVEVIETIQKAISNASNQIGAAIKRVLLCIPSIDTKRISTKTTVAVESMDHRLTVNDIRRAMKQARPHGISKELTPINSVCIKYTCNGITTRKMPLNEICDSVTVDIDYLYANREMTYDLVGCVEKAGLEVLDVCLDTFAIAKEAALFEQSVDQSVVVIKLERQMASLAILYHGKLSDCIISDIGLQNWINHIAEKYELSDQTVARLLKYSVCVDQDKYSDSPIYVWAKNGETHQMSEHELMQVLKEDMKSWCQEINTLCEPILSRGKSMLVITGEGGEIVGLESLLKEVCQCEVKRYCPETLGVRDSSLTSVLGLFYAYQDQLPLLQRENDECIDMVAFTDKVTYKPVETDEQESTITKKIKGMIWNTSIKERG